jgi:ribulose-phosphate 3-epimerase
MKKSPNWKNKIMIPKIIPAILVSTFDEFKNQITRITGLFDLAQIDIMDGEFVPNKSFEEIDQINEIDNLPDLELHLMVKHPLTELEKWTTIKNIKKIIFHIESNDNPKQVINFARGKCWQVGIAVNPETPLIKIESYLEKIDEVLFMTVNPGKQGSPFLPEIGEKIKEFAEFNPRPLIAVDGGINENNIAMVKSWGTEIFCVGSYLTMAEDIKIARDKLLKLTI